MRICFIVISLLLTFISTAQVEVVVENVPNYGNCNILYYKAPLTVINPQTVIFIPGRGSHRTGNTYKEQLINSIGPLQFVTHNLWRPNFNIIVLQPNQSDPTFLVPNDGTIDKVLELKYYGFVKHMLHAIVNVDQSSRPDFPSVNKNKIYMTGLSLGAHYIHSYLRRMSNNDINPQAVVTMSISMTEPYTAGYSNFQNIPMWGLIGDKDNTVKPEDTQYMPNSSFFSTMSGFWMDMRNAGWPDKRLTIYDGYHQETSGPNRKEGAWQYFFNPVRKIPEVLVAPYFKLVDNPPANSTSKSIYEWMLQYGPNEIVLPVTFHSFKAHYINTETILQWSTASETNNSHFIIERSEDGVNFQEVGRVASQAKEGNSSGLLNYIFKLFSK